MNVSVLVAQGNKLGWGLRRKDSIIEVHGGGKNPAAVKQQPKSLLIKGFNLKSIYH